MACSVYAHIRLYVEGGYVTIMEHEVISKQQQEILADHNKLAVTKGVLELLQIMLALKGALLTAVPSDNTDTANNSTAENDAKLEARKEIKRAGSQIIQQVGLHWDMLALVRSIYIKLVIGGDVADVQECTQQSFSNKSTLMLLLLLLLMHWLLLITAAATAALPLLLLLLLLLLLSQSNKGVSTPVTDAPRLLLLTLPGLTSEDVQSLEDTLKRVLATALDYNPKTAADSTINSNVKGFNGGKGVSPKAGTGGMGSRARFDTARQKEQKEAFRDILRKAAIEHEKLYGGNDATGSELRGARPAILDLPDSLRRKSLVLHEKALRRKASASDETLLDIGALFDDDDL
eukprot:9991-Heterococcus_DN1.PRE.2